MRAAKAAELKKNGEKRRKYKEIYKRKVASGKSQLEGKEGIEFSLIPPEVTSSHNFILSAISETPVRNFVGLRNPHPRPLQ